MSQMLRHPVGRGARCPTPLPSSSTSAQLQSLCFPGSSFGDKAATWLPGGACCTRAGPWLLSTLHCQGSAATALVAQTLFLVSREPEASHVIAAGGSLQVAFDSVGGRFQVSTGSGHWK